MFAKLKEKLKKSLSIFKKKTEEAADQPPVASCQLSVEEKKEARKVEDKQEVKEENLVEGNNQEPGAKSQDVDAGVEKQEKVEEPVVEEKKEEEVEVVPETKSKEVVESIEETADQLPVEEKKEEEKVEDKIEVKEENLVEGNNQEPGARGQDVDAGVEKQEKVEEQVVEEKKPVEEPKEKKEEEKKGFFQKAKQFFTTKTISESQFEDMFFDFEVMLLQNNTSYGVIEKIKEDLKQILVDKPIPRDVAKVIEDSLKQSLQEVLDIETPNLLELAEEKKPLVIAFFGINGSGKTTTLAKVANFLQKNGKTVVAAAGDTFRAAAIQQIEEHSNRLGFKLIKHTYGADSAAVCFDAVSYAKKKGVDIVLMDTAGRLHTDVNLMDELKKICRVTNPDLKIFVGESITGNDCIDQIQKFNEIVGIDGIVLTKVDVDDKGGTAISVNYVTKKPILYLGFGQEYDDLKEFKVEEILNSVF